MVDATNKPASDLVNIMDAAGRGASYQYTLDTASLPRLASLIQDSADDSVGGESVKCHVAVTIRFQPARRPARATLSGTIDSQLSLMCQRCLELAPIDQSQSIDSVVVEPDVTDDDLQDEGIKADRWDHQGDTLSISEFVDEFLVLNLPLVVRHANREHCGALANKALPGDVNENEDRQTPFAGLAELMSKRSSE